MFMSFPLILLGAWPQAPNLSRSALLVLSQQRPRTSTRATSWWSSSTNLLAIDSDPDYPTELLLTNVSVAEFEKFDTLTSVTFVTGW